MGRMIAPGWVGPATVEGRLIDACMANGLLSEKGQAAIHDKIKRGIEAGMKNPHEPLPDRQREAATGDNAKIIELSKLRPLDYGKVRKAAAQQLGVDLTILDGAVKERTKAKTRNRQTFCHTGPSNRGRSRLTAMLC